MVVEFDSFRARLPALDEFFGPANVGWLLLVLGATKVLHELGHALAARHFGGECHEMGLMLLVFAPALYCNVSDSWLLSQKRQRALIGAAGMLVELVVAACATLVWWFSQPGLLNYLALNVMFIGSASTVVFNANPLLRYDGYYILSDLADIANLSHKANQVVLRAARRLLLGIESADDPLLPARGRGWLCLYALSSAAYRWVLVASILLLVHRALRPHGLEILGQLLAVSAVGGLVVRPLWRLLAFFRVPGRIDKVQQLRIWSSAGVVAAAVAAVWLVPLPHHVYCPVELEPGEGAAVYVERSGRLVERMVAPGDRVTAGDRLARLEDEELQLQLAVCRGQAAEMSARLAGLAQQRFHNPGAALELAQVQEALQALNQQIAQKQSDVERLVLTAPIAGTVLPPARRRPSGHDKVELSDWSGLVLEDRNLGCSLAEGDLLCRIGHPGTLKAVLVIDQSDIELIRAGQTVEIQLDAFAGRLLRGTIGEISGCELVHSPGNLSHKTGGQLTTRTDAAGRERPASTSYQARVFPLDGDTGPLRIGLRGQARVQTPRQTLAQRIATYLRQTLQFRL